MNYVYSYKERRILRLKIFIGICIFLAIAILTTLVLRFVIYPVNVRSDSMMPEISNRSLVLVSPLIPVKRGDIVLVESQKTTDMGFFKSLISNFVSFVTFQQVILFQDNGLFTENDTVRRVVGLPGDTVYVKNYVVYVKPANSSHFLTEFELTSKSYDITTNDIPENWQGNIGALGNTGEIVLGENEYFVLCDIRNSGIDSRIWGSVTKDRVKGRAFFQYFPFSLFGGM